MTDPARQALAAAINAHREAADALARLQDAEERIDQLSLDAGDDEERAEALLKEARSAEPHSYISALLAGREPGDDPVPAAERALESAQRRHRMAQEARQNIWQKISEAKREVEKTEYRVRYAIISAVKASPEVAKLLKDYIAAETKLIEIGSILSRMSRIGTVYAGSRPKWNECLCSVGEILIPSEIPQSKAWENAIKQLEIDPYAELPTE